MPHVRFVVPEDESVRHYFQMPLDVATAAAVLRQQGHTVSLWDRRADAEPPDEQAVDGVILVTAIADRAQCYPLDVAPIREAVRSVRGLHPGAWIAACGPHATQMPAATLDALDVDHVCIGETDAASVYAAGALLGGTAASDVLDARTADAEFDLAKLPLPAYDLLPMHRYRAEMFDGKHLYHGPSGLVFGARGCTYGCTYCHLPFGTRIRTRPVERVLAEVDALAGTGISSVFFLDYVFGITPPFYRSLCQGLSRRRVTWTGQTRVEIVLKSDVRQWAEAGCQGMWLGAESPAVSMTGVDKRVTDDAIQAAVTKLETAGIQPFTFVLIGLPGDPSCRSGTIVDWAAQLPAKFGVNQLFLRPGTTLYDEFAPRYLGGRMPVTWDEVKAVTETYRREYPVDLDELDERLRALPNYLGNSWQPYAL
ncbi:B12-binding domain-containing radical SAM protein [Streptomyces sp. NPDC050658]|uniref:B12-binding domain-containing radical SAM protein n=1 Tax=unclassified Streptomyces TaxID=2593676 RepID=UPI00342C6F2A